MINRKKLIKINKILDKQTLYFIKIKKIRIL